MANDHRTLGCVPLPHPLPMASPSPQHGQEGLGSLYWSFGSCSRVSVSSLWSFGDPTPRFWGTLGFQGSHSLPLPAQADAAPPAPRGGTRRGQQHRRLWRWGRSSSCSAGHAAASGRHPRCLREQRGASADLQGPHIPRQLPTVGPSPCCTLTRVGAHPARRGDTHLGVQRGGRASWGGPGGGTPERSGAFQAPAAPRRWAPPAPASGPCAALW